MDDAQFTRVYLPRYEGAIKALARKLAKRDQDLFEDLCQEGRVALWKLDVARATTNEDAWIRQALMNNMVSFLRRERLDKYESLEAHLARGDQLVEGPDGEPTLRSTTHPRRSFDGPAGDQDDDEA